MRHIASTDASVSRTEAAAMVTSWYLTSAPALSATDANAASPQAAQGRPARQAGSGAAAVLEIGGRSLTDEERLLANDRCAPWVCCGEQYRYISASCTRAWCRVPATQHQRYAHFADPQTSK
jgi:hypothetical protein